MRTWHGIMACYATQAVFIEALRKARAAGYTRLEVYTPYFVEETEELLPPLRSPIPAIMLIAGILGGCTALVLQIWAAEGYEFNVGGRPLLSWPSYIPVTFELTVLCAALVGVGAFLWIAGFPRLHHPVFNDPRFTRASQDRFFLCIRVEDEPARAQDARALLLRSQAESIEEVYA